jgi:hypothetical protein
MEGFDNSSQYNTNTVNPNFSNNPSNVPLFGKNTTSTTIVPWNGLGTPLQQKVQVQSTTFDQSSNVPFSLIPSNSSNNYTSDSSNNITRYDPTNYSLTYHADQDTSSNFYQVVPNIVSPVYDVSATTWVPNYEQSVYFSKLTGGSTVDSS